MNQNRAGEAEVVDAEPLSTVLRAWIVKWLAERPLLPQSDLIEEGGTSTSDGRRAARMHFMGPIQWLSWKTEINPRRVSGICNGEYERVPLSQADALLTAIGEFDLLGHEIPVKKNPTWSMEAWLAYMEERGCV